MTKALEIMFFYSKSTILSEKRLKGCSSTQSRPFYPIKKVLETEVVLLLKVNHSMTKALERMFFYSKSTILSEKRSKGCSSTQSRPFYQKKA